MKKSLMTLSALSVLPLIGCAGPPITVEDVALETNRLTIQREERLAKEAADTKELEALASLDPTQQGMAYMAKQMKDLVVAVINKDQRQAMGFYDAKASIAGQQNNLIDKLTGRVLKASVVGGAIWAATDVAKHGMDKAGDKVDMNGDNNSTEINRVDAKSKTTTRQIGDENATGPSDAVASGPDKSSTVTEVVAPEPELPKVEEPEIEEPEGEFVPTEPPDFPDGPVEIPGPEAAE